MSVIEIRSQEHFEQLLRSTKVVLADCMFHPHLLPAPYVLTRPVWAQWYAVSTMPCDV
jgi:hypothetical protein